MMKELIHIEGYIYYDKEENDFMVCQEKHGNTYVSLFDNIYNEITPDMLVGQSDNGDYDEYIGGVSIKTKPVKVSYYYSDIELSLEDTIKRHVAVIIGGNLDMWGECYGYSELTIRGMNCDLKVGGHDLIEELKTYEGKYIHLLIEY